MSAQFLTDETGRTTAVLVPIEEYEQLPEDLEDLAAIAERRDEKTLSHEEVVTELVIEIVKVGPRKDVYR